MKKTLFIALALMMFSISVHAQMVVIPYNVDYPYYYMDNSIDSIHVCNHDGVHCQPDYRSIVGNVCGHQGQNHVDYTASANGELAIGFYPDSTLHVVGVAFLLYSFRGIPSSPAINDALELWGNVNQIDASLYNPNGSYMQQLSTSTITSDDIDTSEYKVYAFRYTSDGGITNWVYGGSNQAMYYLWEIFFDNETDVTDSFYISVNVRRLSGFAENLCTGFLEYHTPAGGVYNWPRMKYRIKSDTPNVDTPWQCDETPCYPMVFPIIRRECDSCPQVREVEVVRSSATQVFLRWQRGENHQDWQVAYGPAGTSPENCTMMECTQPMSGLITINTDSQYVAYVRARCHFANDNWGPWSDPATIWFDDPNGIDGVAPPEVTLTPNPTHGTVTVASSAQLTRIEVYDPQGRLLRSVAADGTTATLDLTALSPAVYTLIIHTASGSQTRKLTVAR